MSQLAFVVDDTVFIKKRGDTSEIQSSERPSVTVSVKRIEWQRRSDNQPPVVRQGKWGLILVDLPSGSVKRGDEVWTIRLPPSK